MIAHIEERSSAAAVSGVVDEHVEAAGFLFELGCGGLDARSVRHIELQNLRDRDREPAAVSTSDP